MSHSASAPKYNPQEYFTNYVEVPVEWTPAAHGACSAKSVANSVLLKKSTEGQELTEEQKSKIKDTIDKNGLRESQSYVNKQEFHEYGCVFAIGWVCDEYVKSTSSSPRPDFDFRSLYVTCIHSVNAITYFLENSRKYDETSRNVSFLELKERKILERVWDISVCLLGAFRARASLFNPDVVWDDKPILHPRHYREVINEVSIKNRTRGEGRICNRLLFALTRPEIPPFIRPEQLLHQLKYKVSFPNMVDHSSCENDHCKLDSTKPSGEYHSPGCPGCDKRTPPGDQKIQNQFSEIVCNNKMPAINIEDGPWWVEANDKTLAVSHVWRDGIDGTRDQGINNCIHELFKKIAKDKGCQSYWIDCAIFPENPPEQRSKMIEKINSTFHNSGVTLCLDNGFANRHLQNTSNEANASNGSSTSNENNEDNDTDLLLSLIISLWHRRAWTLLEGNKSKSQNMHFLRWKKQRPNGVQEYELFPFHEKLKATVNNTGTPLWVLSTLAKFLPYMNCRISPDTAGLMLSSRKATRPGDSLVIWSLVSSQQSNIDKEKRQNPYHDTTSVDTAFISSNAQRLRGSKQCWMPITPDATAWVRTAYGGIKGTITRRENRLEAEWWTEEFRGNGVIDKVDWESPMLYDQDPERSRVIENLKEKIYNGRYDCTLACPVLDGDPTQRDSNGSQQSGTFQNGLKLICDRAILLTRVKDVQGPWNWETMVPLRPDKVLCFTRIEKKRFLAIGNPGC